jgi:hypothetical protein
MHKYGEIEVIKLFFYMCLCLRKYTIPNTNNDSFILDLVS